MKIHQAVMSSIVLVHVFAFGIALEVEGQAPGPRLPQQRLVSAPLGMSSGAINASQGTLPANTHAPAHRVTPSGAINAGQGTLPVNTRDPAHQVTLGGAAGRSRTVTRTVTTADELVSLLKSDYQGVIYIPDGTSINMQDHRDVPIQSGVTLKSNRGGTRRGGRIYTTKNDEKYALFVVQGSNVRIEGLQIEGPSRSEDAPYKVNGIQIKTVDSSVEPPRLIQDVIIIGNNLSGWPGAAVSVSGEIDAECFADLPPADRLARPWHAMHKSQAGNILITGNYIHHNLRHDLGYGVSVGGGAYAMIQANVFEYNRHAVASSGTPYSGYIARDNYHLASTAFPYHAHYDMHGCDGSDGVGGDAGEYVEIAYNTIRGEQDVFGFWARKAFRIRGIPRDSAWFLENVVVHDDFGEAIDYYGSGERVDAEGNSFDVDHSLELGVGDFDGDGRDDVFLATGAGWYFSSSGLAAWAWLTRSEITRKDVGLGDFDGDGFTDVLVKYNGQWQYFSGRERRWKQDLLRDHRTTPNATAAIPVSALRFGDFDGNGITDVFRADGTHWYVSWDGRRAWDIINSSTYGVDHLLFGDFDDDGRTDVFNVRNGEWSWSSGGQTAWMKLNDRLAFFSDVVLGDFDGDGRTDVAYETSSEWRWVPGGRGPSLRLRDKDADPHTSIKQGVIGRFRSSATGKRDSFLRFIETPAPAGRGTHTGLKFVAWYYGTSLGDAFFSHSRQNMR